jgi:ubiquinone/menaquinone biosynthesis C-methylase UbiE
MTDRVEVRFADGREIDKAFTGWVKRATEADRPGLREVGLAISAAPAGPLLPIERRDSMLVRGSAAAARDRLQLIRGGVQIAVRRGLERIGIGSRSVARPDVVRFQNARGEHIVGLVDSWNAQPGAPVVVMPPAWAKTKETLLPLARTIVATFERARQPIVVLRLDGIRRRGESYNDPECRAPGCECHRMTFSQGVSDIAATLDYVENSERFRSSRIALVTFSGASIEARKAIAEETRGRVAGWVSVVGAADLKSGLQTVSGGQDFIGGFETGVNFGIQRVLGIETDVDLVSRDAVDSELAYLEDARRQMARIRVPITWIQGRDDAWIDPRRVREILSCGDASQRRLVEVPTGHQLRTSAQALECFQLIAGELGRFLTGKPLAPVLPDLASMEERRRAERHRLPRTTIDLREFWSGYLLGRDGRLGMDLLTSTTPYRELMALQVDALELREGDRVVDLGSGTGTVPRLLSKDRGIESHVEIHELDFLREALSSTRRRLSGAHRPRVAFVSCNLSLRAASGTCFIPMRDESYDAAIASLLLNYIDHPERFLVEVRRILRPGGRLVLSALRKDTDISKIYHAVSEEIRGGIARDEFQDLSSDDLDESIQSFLNESGRLLDLEEQGFFHFWDPEELVALVRSTGFETTRVSKGFGHPPQAIIVSAVAR